MKNPKRKQRKSKGRKAKRTSRILGDHKREGKKLVPPLLANDLPLSGIESVGEMIPNVVWAALVVDSLPLARAVEIIRGLSAACQENAEEERRLFVYTSDFSTLKSETKLRVLQGLAEAGILRDVQRSLYPLASLYRETALDWLYDGDVEGYNGEEIERCIRTMQRVVGQSHDRHFPGTVHAQGAIVYAHVMAGRLGLPLATTYSRTWMN